MVAQSSTAAASYRCHWIRFSSTMAANVKFRSRAAAFRVVEVTKGDPPPSGVIAEPVFRADAQGMKSAPPLLLLREDRWPQWVNFG
jgi:hypothetical protein